MHGEDSSDEQHMQATTAAAGPAKIATADKAGANSVLPKPWTNPSVLALASGGDPVDTITERARDLVMRALDADWHGPPFDPVALAQVLGIEIRALSDIPDARTVPLGRERFRIEFNPNRPPGRIRYSVAHEIGHTLFPDCANRVRNRLAHADATRDEWQLEMLCNIAAAEILMPFGSFPTFHRDLLDINRILGLQRQFNVSTEALLLRVVHVAPVPCAAFCASNVFIEGEARWRLDYVIGSASWSGNEGRGDLLPKHTVVGRCQQVGFTDSGDESWRDRKLHIEVVAIPPYPGSIVPRAVGLMMPADSEAASEIAEFREVVGDAMQPRGEGTCLIAHVVTDKAQTWGGNGFAAAMRRRFPTVHDDFSQWAGLHGRNLALGKVRFINIDERLRVATMVAQHGYGPARSARLRYAALQTCLAQVFRAAAQDGTTVHLPRIGTGHGGGAWEIIRDLLVDAVVRWRVSATVYRLPTAAAPDAQQNSIAFGSVDGLPRNQ